MKKINIIALLTLIILTSSKEIYSQNLHEVMMRATYQIIGFNDEGNYSNGSCFFVGKPVRHDSTKLYYVLVTARHVLESITKDEAYIKARIKMSDSTYRVIDYKIKIRDKGKDLYFTQYDSTIDVATLYISIPNEFELDLIPSTYLADEEYLKSIEIHPGDNVFCVGFPLGRPSNDYFFPILSDGIISSYPILPIKVYKRILLNINIFSGNSGGPIYIHQLGRTIKRTTYMDKFYFKIIGLLASEFINTESYEVGKIKFTEITNMKIAVIVPSIYIKEVIDSMPELE